MPPVNRFKMDPLTFLNAMTTAIAHDIYSPLEGLQINLQLLERQISKKDEREIAPVLTTAKRIRRDIERLMSMLEAFHNPTTAPELHVEPSNLSNLVQKTLSLENYQFAREGIDIETDFDAGLPPVNVDHVRLRRIILNLCAGMSQMAGAGEKLLVRGYRSKGRIFLDVSGHGKATKGSPGISDIRLSERTGSVALGLVVAHRLARAYGGRITYLSGTEGKSVFRLSLPVKRETRQLSIKF